MDLWSANEALLLTRPRVNSFASIVSVTPFKHFPHSNRSNSAILHVVHTNHINSYPTWRTLSSTPFYAQDYIKYSFRILQLTFALYIICVTFSGPLCAKTFRIHIVNSGLPVRRSKYETFQA